MIALLGALWTCGCGKPQEVRPPASSPDRSPAADRPAARPDAPSETSAAEPAEPDGAKVAAAVGKALFKGVTGRSLDRRPRPDDAPRFRQ
jgi:hypothetical protein